MGTRNSHKPALHKDQTLWHPDLAKATPSKLFMMLLDYSKDGTLQVYWVAVKELKLSYYIAETLLFTMYTHYGNLI